MYMSALEGVLNSQDVNDFVEALSTNFKDISAEKIIELLPKIIEYVQKYKKLSGEQKKALIIKVLNLVIDKTDGPGDDEIFDPILKRLVPVLIDTFVKIGKKKIKFKKPGFLARCFGRCL